MSEGSIDSMKEHHYKIGLEWTGNQGTGTDSYRSYSRNHEIIAEGKASSILGSSDPSFSGDPTRYNPEELFLSSLSACHMLWYLHLCAKHGVVVTDYADAATGTMQEERSGSGRFTQVTLYPMVTVAEQAMVKMANQLHEQANAMCFIANSCNFKVGHQPITKVKG